MIIPLLLISSFPALVSSIDATTCAGKKNLCPDHVTDCATIFPQTAGVPSPNCFSAAYADFADLCQKTCQTCCTVPCVDVNPRCSSWTDGFCTNPFYSDINRWDDCRKKCNMC